MVKEILARFGLAELPAPAPALSPPAQEQMRVLSLTRAPTSSQGTEVFAGYFAEEYLSKLRGKMLAIEFDKMRRSDPQIQMLLRAAKNPIKAARWEIRPADENDEASKAIAELVEHILFCACEKPFSKTVGEALTMIDFGHAVMEPTFKLVLNDPEYGSFHGINSIDLVSAKTIEKWVLDPVSGKLQFVQQIANGDLAKTVMIPAEDLLVFTLDQEGANYEGISWLRACYGNWFRKNLYQKLNAIGIEKFAVPTPLVEFPAGAQNDDQFSHLMSALEVYTSGQANYLTKPQGYSITLEKNAYDPQKVEASIDKEDERMARAFLANFLTLGVGGNSGAYALGDDLSDFFLSGLTHVADEVACTMNPLIKRLVDLNFGPQAKYPTLHHVGISDKAGKELAEIMGLLIDKKVVRPDDPLEEFSRKKYGLPEASEEGRADRAPSPPTAPGFPGAPGAPGAGGPPPPPGAPGGAPPPAPGKTLSERIYRRLAGIHAE